MKKIVLGASVFCLLLLTFATVTDAQIKVDGKANRFIQIGGKLLSQINSPYTKALGGAVGFLFAEEKQPEYAELKKSLESEWLLDIDDRSKNDYKKFVDAKRIGYKNGLQKIKLFEKLSASKAAEEAQNLSTLIYADIPLFYKSEMGKPYPAAATLPYLYGAMTLDLDILKMQINWEQQNIDSTAAGDTNTLNNLIGRRNATIAQYNREFVDFWKILQSEIFRARTERLAQVIVYMQTYNGGTRYIVRDQYYGRGLDEGSPNVLFDVDWRHGRNRNPLTEYIAADVKASLAATLQINKETNAYDMAPYGIYRSTAMTFDKRKPVIYSCTEMVKFVPFELDRRHNIISLNLSCPMPGGGVYEPSPAVYPTALTCTYGRVSSGPEQYCFWTTSITGQLNSARNNEILVKKGILNVRTEDGSEGITADSFNDYMASQTVTNTNDSGPGSLRQAIDDGGLIYVSAIQGKTITLTSGPIEIYARDVKIITNGFRNSIKLISPEGEKTFVVEGGIKFYNNGVGGNLEFLADKNGKDIKCGLVTDTTITVCPGIGMESSAAPIAVVPTVTPSPAKLPTFTPGPGITREPATTTTARTNVALASNGGVASASSTIFENLPNYPSYPPSSAINGDRTASKWSGGGGWNDATTSEFPDWLQVDFSGSKSIDEITVVTLQDGYGPAGVPAAETKFTKEGIRDFVVQYWNGADWVAVPDGTVKGNDLVIRTFKFTPVSTTKIRVTVTAALQDYSRIVQLEAWGKN